MQARSLAAVNYTTLGIRKNANSVPSILATEWGRLRSSRRHEWPETAHQSGKNDALVQSTFHRKPASLTIPPSTLNPEELFYEVFATLYRNLGIDVKSAQLIDAAGRPKYLVDKRDVISELV